MLEQDGWLIRQSLPLGGVLGVAVIRVPEWLAGWLAGLPSLEVNRAWAGKGQAMPQLHSQHKHKPWHSPAPYTPKAGPDSGHCKDPGPSLSPGNTASACPVSQKGLRTGLSVWLSPCYLRRCLFDIRVWQRRDTGRSGGFISSQNPLTREFTSLSFYEARLVHTLSLHMSLLRMTFKGGEFFFSPLSPWLTFTKG